MQVNLRDGEIVTGIPMTRSSSVDRWISCHNSDEQLAESHSSDERPRQEVHKKRFTICISAI